MKTNEIIGSQTDGFGSFSVLTWTESHPLISVLSWTIMYLLFEYVFVISVS